MRVCVLVCVIEHRRIHGAHGPRVSQIFNSKLHKERFPSILHWPRIPLVELTALPQIPIAGKSVASRLRRLIIPCFRCPPTALPESAYVKPVSDRKTRLNSTVQLGLVVRCERAYNSTQLTLHSFSEF
jgi:hypothetical protein